MGLNMSSDKWCCQSDVLIRGIPWARKIVDDTLIWAKDMEELVDRTRVIVDRCRKNNITISRKKLELGKRIHFAGHIISDEGIQPDEEKYAAISKFPIWSEWRLTVIAATVRIALVDILDLSEVDIPAGGFLYPAVGWG